jgi:hypothetical protein
MPRALLIANQENATIEEFKKVSRLGSNETTPAPDAPARY